LRNSEILSCLSPSDLKPDYTEYQKAVVYVVGDYLAKNYNMMILGILVPI